MTLPAALAPLQQRRQWIVYRREPLPTGKLNKIPVRHYDLTPCNAHDPGNWVSYHEAVDACVGYPDYGVGFVFTDADPYWFLDIDNCLTPEGWSPLAQELCALLAGAAVEVSVSGRGLHVIGTGKVPPHSAKNAALGLEFYHTGRFMALGSGAMGDCNADKTEAVAVLVGRYFERRNTGSADALWTSAPVAEWRGPADDDELIRRAFLSKSSAAAFGNKASFAQLWDADAMALCKVWPDTARGPGGYDASSADAALAQHLAFWTGKDCARMERLMRRSSLRRAKWDEHASYMQRTITQAVAQQQDVLQDKPPATVAPASAPAPLTREARDVEGSAIIPLESQKILFHGCTYVEDLHAIMLPNGAMLNEGRFNVMLGGWTFVLSREEGKMAKNAWDAFTNNKQARFPKVNHAEFRPDLEPGALWEKNGHTYVNSYVPLPVACKQGSAKPFLDHLAKLLPEQSDRDILLAYMAAVVQYPGRQFTWAPVLQGVEGNGKTLINRVIMEAVGLEHCHVPKASQLASRFNDWLDGKIFIAVEDLFKHEDDSIIEALTPMITNPYQEIEAKGGKKVTRRVVAKFIFNSNKKDAVRKKLDGRRFAIFYTAQQRLEDLKNFGMLENYFPNLYGWLDREGYAACTFYLRNYSIPDALNPATSCQRAPVTTSTAEAIELGGDTLGDEILEAVSQGDIGFREGWISSHFVDKLVRENRLEAKYNRHRRTQTILDLGYVQHPGLAPTGQVHNVVAPDGKKPRLFIKPGHPAENLRGAAIAKAYSEAQTNLAVAAGGLQLVA